MTTSKILRFVISVAIPLLVGGISSFFTMDSINTWYLFLEKPFFNPPNWIFGPVWTFLYILMGVSFFLVWEKTENFFHHKSFYIYVSQLVLNFFWSIIFFGLKSPFWAFVIIVMLWLTLLWNIIEFRKIDTLAGNILIPYLFWVSFASILNLSIIILN